MPNPIHAFLIGSPAIVGCCNAPGSRKVALLIPVGKVIVTAGTEDGGTHLY